MIRCEKGLRMTKVKVIKGLVFFCIIIMLIHVAHALTLDRIVQYREITFSSPRIPESMDGYRIAFVTDTHEISETRLRGIVDRLNDLRIDLLLLGGDFSYGSMFSGDDPDEPRRTMEALAQVITTDGIFGVYGNHDYLQVLSRDMEDNGIKLLQNSGLHVRENFYLGGVSGRSPSVYGAMRGSGPDDFSLLMAHVPDVSMRQDTLGVDLILSGHTHGGQVTFFGLWAPVLSVNYVTHYGQRFRSGWAYSRDGVPVFVSNGAGEYVPRVFARPQVIIFTLTAE